MPATDLLGERDAWHPLRRAGFGAHASEVAELALLSPAAAVDALLAVQPSAAPPVDFALQAPDMQSQQGASDESFGLPKPLAQVSRALGTDHDGLRGDHTAVLPGAPFPKLGVIETRAAGQRRGDRLIPPGRAGR